MKVLCAVDFTPRGQAAAKVAADLAGRTGGSVELIHVTGPSTADILAWAASATVLDEEVRAGIDARLAAECDRIATADVQVSGHVCNGEVEPSILELGRRVTSSFERIAPPMPPPLPVRVGALSGCEGPHATSPTAAVTASAVLLSDGSSVAGFSDALV